MKHKLDKIETILSSLSGKVDDHATEITLLRQFKHDTNAHIHNHNGKFNIIEAQQQDMVNEIKLMRGDFNKWMDKTDALITWRLKIKFAGVGASAVIGIISALIIASFYILKMYMDYHK